MSTEEDPSLVDAEESMEEGSVTQDATEETEEEEEQEQGDEAGPSERKRSSRKKGGKGGKKGSKKSAAAASKVEIPDPYNSTSEEVCAAIGLTDVEFDYDEEEFQGISNLKVIIQNLFFKSRFLFSSN